MSNQLQGKIGPHQGQEAELLLTGRKPVALFSAPFINHQFEQIKRLDHAVDQGLLCKAFVTSAIAERTFYCLPESQAQMEELIAIYQRIDDQTPPNPTEMSISLADHHRIGTLLGYAPEDIAAFLKQQYQREQGRCIQAPCPQP